MKIGNKKESVSFSYLDVFLLLLAGLILSFCIYFSIEKKEQEKKASFYLVEVEAFYEEELIPLIPGGEETLWDKKGNSIGKVLSVSHPDEASEGRVVVLCLLQEGDWRIGNEFCLETARCVKMGTILSFAKQTQGQEMVP